MIYLYNKWILYIKKSCKIMLKVQKMGIMGRDGSNPSHSGMSWVGYGWSGSVRVLGLLYINRLGIGYKQTRPIPDLLLSLDLSKASLIPQIKEKKISCSVFYSLIRILYHKSKRVQIVGLLHYWAYFSFGPCGKWKSNFSPCSSGSGVWH